jgi:hypothetical protein
MPGLPGAARAMTRNGRGRWRNESIVFILDEGRLLPVPVRTGMTDYEYTEILSGLEEGQEVAILPSASLLQDQERVRQFFRRFREATMPVSKRKGNGR